MLIKIIICILLILIVPEILKKYKHKWLEQLKDYLGIKSPSKMSPEFKRDYWTDIKSLSKKPVSIFIDLSHSSCIDRDIEAIEKTVQEYAESQGIKVIHNREVKNDKDR